MAHWALMVVAMMLPLVLTAIRAASRRSLWQRRDRAIGGFLVGYLGLWLLVGLSASAVASVLRLDDPGSVPQVAAVAFGVAAAWQNTAVKRRALWSCHRSVPLAPDGWRADRDCVGYGWMIGKHCLLSCWAMMLAGVLTGSLPVMATVFVLSATERYANRPQQWPISSVLAGLALLYAVLAFSRM
jgi:predicted metal-binding membrane protein